MNPFIVVTEQSCYRTETIVWASNRKEARGMFKLANAGSSITDCIVSIRRMKL